MFMVNQSEVVSRICIIFCSYVQWGFVLWGFVRVAFCPGSVCVRPCVRGAGASIARRLHRAHESSFTHGRIHGSLLNKIQINQIKEQCLISENYRASNRPAVMTPLGRLLYPTNMNHNVNLYSFSQILPSTARKTPP